MSKTEKKSDEIVSQILNGDVKNDVLKNFIGDGKNQVYYAIFAFKKLVESLTESKLSKEIELEVYNSLLMLLDVTGNHHQLSYVLYKTITSEVSLMSSNHKNHTNLPSISEKYRKSKEVC